MPENKNPFEQPITKDQRKSPTTEEEVIQLLKETQPEKWKSIFAEWWKSKEIEQPDSIELNVERAEFYYKLYKLEFGDDFLDAMYENYEAVLRQTTQENKTEKYNSVSKRLDDIENELSTKNDNINDTKI